ncbi:MAG: DUF4111 domain-containing protein [Actinobacteria bacterium]|nr:DUF4111 domain-containing protein [Actinomycetota bacterium]
MTVETQIEQVVAGLRQILGDDLVGVYLYGSAVLGGLQPRSDLDVFVVAHRRTTLDEKRRIVEHLLDVSGAGPRPIELTIVVQSEVKPWRYPPTMDFQYGEWLRDEFESGNLEPWPTTNPDLASLVTMVLLADRPLLGPPPAEVLDTVPSGDYAQAVADGLGSLLDDLETDARNVILTLARIWSSLATGTVRSKDEAADWALARLPEEHRPPLARARAIYLGEQEGSSLAELGPAVRAHADHVLGEIASVTR